VVLGDVAVCHPDSRIGDAQEDVDRFACSDEQAIEIGSKVLPRAKLRPPVLAHQLAGGRGKTLRCPELPD
jgi:hypothetical protein